MIQQLEHHLLETEQLGQTTIAKIKTRSVLDESTIQSLGSALKNIASDVGPGTLLLNLELVDRFSSAMIGKLLAVRKRIHDAGGRVALCGLRPELAKLFTMTNLDRLYDIYSNEEEALQHL